MQRKQAQETPDCRQCEQIIRCNKLQFFTQAGSKEEETAAAPRETRIEQGALREDTNERGHNRQHEKKQPELLVALSV